jgi:uncharacterized membrane protein
MLIAYPIAFYTGTLVAFAWYWATSDLLAFHIAVVANVAGVVMAAVAALPGFVDWLLGIPKGTQARKDGLVHMVLNVLALAVFAVDAVVHLAQWSDANPDAALGTILAGVGVLLTLGAGFYGWTLIQDHHVGVKLTKEQERLEPAAGG